MLVHRLRGLGGDEQSVAIGGGLLAALAWYSSDISLRLENTTDISPVGYGLQLVAAAGIIGGFVYWLLAGRKVLITAGPTYEAIDPVRGITNLSSGKMGFAVARAAREAHMQHILATLAGLTRADEGQDLLEYGVLTVLIAVVAIGAIMLLGNQVNAVLWQTIVNNF